MTNPSVLETTFFAALAKPTEAERCLYLDEACSGDPELRRQVEKMLAAHFEADEFLEQPAVTVEVITRNSPSITEVAGSTIGPFKLLQQIGEGGMGVVFMAEQLAPIRRFVALKIIKQGMDTRQVIARFEAERQALAMMDHPNVARVLDAGTTAGGRPYFVMELVKGVPITKYCDDRKLSLRARLDLFIPVCMAVQHAHQKGLIHRDIKPTNVLVAEYDNHAVPKVIDFGVAKATAQSMTERTLFTEYGQVVGTVEYMSPEQAKLNQLDIDTRSDIYSLGVLMYELLTGTTPFGQRRLKEAAFDEMLRIIREEEPQKPSTRLSTVDTLPSIAANRGMETLKLNREVRGELDWIAMKCLEKDRARRYDTANGLAADVMRYLTGEPVTAHPPSATYRISKFVRKHRLQVAALSAIGAALVLGLAGTAWQANRASHQRDIALAARDGESRQRQSAEAERDKAKAIAAFMSETLEGAGPSVARGRDITMLKEMMDSAASRIEKGELKGAPEAELRLRGTIGHTYRELALYADAARMLESAVALSRSVYPGDSVYTANALTRLGQLLQHLGELSRAEPVFREALEMDRRIYAGDDEDLAGSINDLAVLLQMRGDLAAAEPLYHEAVDMWKRLFKGDSQDVAGGLTNLAYLHQAQGDLAGAEAFTRQSLEMNQRLFPGEDPDVANGMNNLAYLLQAQGKLTEAEPLYRQSLDMIKRLYPGDHPLVAKGISNLAGLLLMRNDLDRAEPLYLEALAMYKRIYPGDHVEVARCLANVASFYQAREQYAPAETFASAGVAMCERVVGRDHALTGSIRLNLGKVLTHLDRFADAETQLLEAERVLSTAQGVRRGLHEDSVGTLAKLYESWDAAEAGKGFSAKAAKWKALLAPATQTTRP
jgi:serine/threonine protein kinase/tetratricopeptide (TPR) repeat protein